VFNADYINKTSTLCPAVQLGANMESLTDIARVVNLNETPLMIKHNALQFL
jgi:hypothetical protein